MKRYRLHHFSLFWLLLFVSCSGRQTKNFEIQSTRAQYLIDTLDIKTVLLDSIPSSYVGDFAIKNNRLFFVDRLTGKLFPFNKEGKAGQSQLGFGESPYEINSSYIDGFLLGERSSVFIGSNFDIHIFDNQWNRQDEGVIDWKWGTSSINEVEIPDPEERALYTFDYENLKLVEKKDFVYAPVYSEHHNFNPFTTHRFYRESYIIAEISLQTFEVTKLMGKRSKRYLDYKFLGHHAFFDFESAENGFYISHEIDSLIYFMDEDGEMLYAFGREGKQMDKSYKEVDISDLRNKEEVAKVREAFVFNRPLKGCYSGIWFCQNEDLLFRSYTRGGDADLDGLQIYRKEQLVADVSVPKGFRILGSLDGDFIAIPAREEEDKQLLIYTFTLPGLHL